MTDVDKTKNPERIGDTIQPSGALLGPGVDLPGRAALGRLVSQLTLTSVASASARAFGPDESAMVDEFLEAIANFDKKTLFLIDEGVMTPQQVGIETDLEQEKTGVLVKAEIGDREIKEQREHELALARIEARGPIWVEAVKWVLLGAGWFLAAGFGIKVLSSG